jgi:hypothetical protein
VSNELETVSVLFNDCSFVPSALFLESEGNTLSTYIHPPTHTLFQMDLLNSDLLHHDHILSFSAIFGVIILYILILFHFFFFFVLFVVISS